MKRLRAGVLLLVASGGASGMLGQAAGSAPAKHTAYYFDPTRVDFRDVVPMPPAAGSAEAKADMATVLHAQATRKPNEVESARWDDTHEDMFAFATVLGPEFDAANLPLTAAFSAHIRNESGVVTAVLKPYFGRPRPFVANAAVKPVCEMTPEGSYPSGHGMVGYLEALTLAQMVPERAAAIMLRAHEYAMHRIVCGVHYPSDEEASRTVAMVLWGEMAASPKFQADLKAARKEVRARLKMPEEPVMPAAAAK